LNYCSARSHENIYFWCACERYRKLSAGDDRLKLANEIVSKHLGVAATEPVNVDAVARESTAGNLQVFFSTFSTCKAGELIK